MSTLPAERSNARKRSNSLAAARATVHIVSYTEFVLQKKKDKSSSVSKPTTDIVVTQSRRMTQPCRRGRLGTHRIGLKTISFDPAMRRQREAYEADIRRSQQVLTSVAEETGGRIFLPKSSQEMIAQAGEAAREIGAEFVVTYRPKRPLADSRRGEYRRIEVASRRVGLSLRSRRGYVVPDRNE